MNCLKLILFFALLTYQIMLKYLYNVVFNITCVKKLKRIKRLKLLVDTLPNGIIISYPKGTDCLTGTKRVCLKTR